MSIDLETASRMLGVAEKMLLRWAKQGVIPAFERKGDLRFDKKTLTDWAQRRRMPLKEVSQNETAKHSEQVINLGQSLRLGGVYFDVQGSNSTSALKSATQTISLPDGIESKELLRRLLEREKLASTGIGNGVAIPHPRRPFKNAPQEGMICTCFLKEPVDFNAVDGQDVFILFLMLSPNTKLHLHLLAQLSLCLHKPEFIEELRGCRTPQHVYKSIETMENQFPFGQPKGSH